MRRARVWALTMAAIMAVPSMPGTVVNAADVKVANQASYVAEDDDNQADGSDLSYDGYHLVWEDEFEGDALNRKDWNVETHPAHWVNDEWQEYVDNDEVIQVENGVLKINAVKTETASAALLSNADFTDELEGWVETIANWEGGPGADATRDIDAENGAITYDINNTGTEDWNIQLKQTNVQLQKGSTYRVSYMVTSSIDRTINSGVMSEDYKWYGGAKPELNAGEATPVTFEFTMENDDSTANFYISLGSQNADGDETITDNHTVIISNIEMYAVGDDLLDNYDFADGLDGWVQTIANWEGGPGADATHDIDAEKGAITYDINGTGTEDWNIQLKQTDVELEKGATYRVSFKVTSSIDRSINTGVMSENYDWYGGYKPVLKAGEEMPVTYDFTMGKNDSTASFFISLGTQNDAGDETIAENHTVTISDIEFISVKQEAKTSYTAGRISTQDLNAFTYGLFEAKVKVPAGAGYLPAFWLMANEQDLYGEWPLCGEIDCMEVWGSETDKVYGTIHYGNPHKENQGTYIVSGNDFAEDYHTFACEWMPGKIIWYVDGNEYFETNDWYTKEIGQDPVTYPAPFDQPFYIILNLAVGNSWAGNPDEDTKFEDNPFLVDYVKVYQKESYDENVEAPEKEEAHYREPDAKGNYIVNGTFEEEDLEKDEDWAFKTAAGGKAEATIENNEIKIETENEGTQLHSVQLVQAELPMYKGATYEVKFEAKADEARTMDVDLKGPDAGWAKYMPTYEAELTDAWQNYTVTFKMNDESDPNGRLEYNMGNKGSTSTIYIKNVSVKMLEAPSDDVNKKTIRSDGNYLYNGGFTQGTSRLGYWVIEGVGDYSVSNLADKRRFVATVSEGNVLTLSQNELPFTEGANYKFSMDVEADQEGRIVVNVGGNEYLIQVEEGSNTYQFAVDEKVKFENQTIAISLDGGATYKLDNIRFAGKNMITNGSFDSETGWAGNWKSDDAKASFAIEDGAMNVTIENTTDKEWNVQVKQNGISLVEGHDYVLKFSAKSTLARDFRAIMQGKLSETDYSVYSGEGYYSLTDEMTDFEIPFTMTEPSKADAYLSICLGAISENQITEKHTVTFDNISLVDLSEDGDVDCKATFDMNGGKAGDKEVVSINKIAGQTLGTLPVPEKEDYNFLGWFAGKESEQEVTKDTRVTNDITVYAKWEAKPVYTVSCNGNGGLFGEVSYNAVEVKEGKELGEVKAPEREGYIFKGWFTEETAGTEVKASTKITEDTAIYAHWDRIMNYTVSFNANGGALEESKMSKAVKNDEAYGELPVPTLSENKFLGWFTEKEAGNEVSANSIVDLTKDQTLYAHWEPVVKPAEFTVTFDANGGALDKDTSASIKVVSGNAIGELPSATLAGYDFIGWFTAKEGGNAVDKDTKVNEAITVYAQWKKIVDFKVTFDANGGKVATTSKAIKLDTAFGELPTATLVGKAFAGWFTEKNGGSQVTAETMVTLAKDQTLFAKWEDITLVVKQKYDVTKLFVGIDGIEGYKVVSEKTVGGKATINKYGILSAKKAGEITVVPCTKVKGKLVPMENVAGVKIVLVATKFSQKLPVATYVGQVISANDILTGKPANSNTIVWSVNNDKASIDQATGEIKALKSGKVKVTATITNDQEEGKPVVVSTTLTIKIPALSVADQISIRRNKKITVKNTAKNDVITWTSSDEKVVKVEGNGKNAKLVVGDKGTATITCNVNGHSYVTKVTVE